MRKLGIYIHIPFCAKKCAYCDFYSTFAEGTVIERYLSALKDEISKWGGLIDRPIDTIYIGGGTPSVLGKRICDIVKKVYDSFCVEEGAEITVEANPCSITAEFLQSARNAGVNRLSIGVQSGNNTELKILGRAHTAEEAERVVKLAREEGFDNISLDLMLCLPDSNIGTLKNSLDYITALEPEHISAYMLKVEENTLFAKREDLNLPDEEEEARQYLYMCDYLEKKGYGHYEISNFCKEGRKSRHNLKYWLCEEYLGIGPSAHSFLDNKRFYYPDDLKGFISSPETLPDGAGGSAQEELMLALRLMKGIDITEYYNPLPQDLINKLEGYKKQGLITYNHPMVSLTDKGCLVSNTLITELIYEDL
ncbi:MAG: radical SAM family heme chaperone HemW [Clostridia bacterium]|nr:radical SAM family heme chaperone HemW [Clostridia bacterium]